MAKKKKNSNYITEKSKMEKAQAEKKKRSERTAKAIITVLIIILAIALLTVGVVALVNVLNNDTEFEATHHATIEIKDYGTVHLELYGKDAPKTVENFVALAKSGFYNGLTFHRIIDGFMAQGGDPKGDGSGGSPNKIKGEFSANGFNNPILHTRGTISMARATAYDSASSQFFIVHETSDNNSRSLDGKYAAFGRVTSGMDVIDAIIEDAEPGSNGRIEKSEQPIITSITIHAAH